MADPSNSFVETDPIILAVQRLNAGYNNTDFRRRPTYEYGSTKIHAVVFKGQDGEWRENYVFEKGKTITAYHSLVDLLKDRNSYFLPLHRDHETLKLLTIILMTLAFGGTLLYLIAHGIHPARLQVITGLLALLIGYLIGNVPNARH